LTVAASNDFNFGTGDYTIEGWLYSTSLTWTLYSTGGSGSNDQLVCDTGVLYWEFSALGSPTFYTTSDLNRWVHIAVCRSSGIARVFKDGIIFRTVPSTTSIGSNTTADIGRRKDGFYFTDGYINDLRVYKGIAKYTSNFTPPNQIYLT
jgi:hypothetical protein